MADKEAGGMEDMLKNIRKAVRDAEEATIETDGGDVPDLDMEQLKGFVQGFRDQVVQASAPTGPGIVIHWSIILAAFIILFTVVGFFSYRLVQSLREKERKVAEKKKLKEMKKKK